jgi:hypothetical protein
MHASLQLRYPMTYDAEFKKKKKQVLRFKMSYGVTK